VPVIPASAADLVVVVVVVDGVTVVVVPPDGGAANAVLGVALPSLPPEASSDASSAATANSRIVPAVSATWVRLNRDFRGGGGAWSAGGYGV
jgi:hypothetical protein